MLSTHFDHNGLISTMCAQVWLAASESCVLIIH